MFLRYSSSSWLGPYCAEAREALRRMRAERCMFELVFLFYLLLFLAFLFVCLFMCMVDGWLSIVGCEGTIY